MGLFKKKEDLTSEFLDKYGRGNAVLGELYKLFSVKRKKHIGTCLLHEKIGKTEIFHGAFPILKSEDDKLGKYHVININGRFVFVDHIPSDYWTPTTNSRIIKFVEVVKFAEDDFRVRSRVKEDWYCKKPVYKTEVSQIVKTDEETGQPVLDEETGEPEIYQIEKPVLEDGVPVVDKYEEVKWEYPKLVNQEGREAMRIGNDYEQRMRDKRNKKNEFWEKYGTFISMTVGIIIICATLITTTKLNIDAQKDFIKEFRGEMDEARESSGIIDATKLANKIYEVQERNKNEEGKPPS